MYLGTDRPGKLMVDNLSAFLVTSPLTSSNATFLYDGQTYLQEACRDMSEDGNNFKFHKIAAAGYPLQGLDTQWAILQLHQQLQCLEVYNMLKIWNHSVTQWNPIYIWPTLTQVSGGKFGWMASDLGIPQGRSSWKRISHSWRLVSGQYSNYDHCDVIYLETFETRSFQINFKFRNAVSYNRQVDILLPMRKLPSMRKCHQKRKLKYQ